MNTTLNMTTITGHVINTPTFHDNEGNSPTGYFVMETPSFEYIRAKGSRHISRLERIPVKCCGAVASIARNLVTHGCNVLLTGAIQTTPMTDDQGRRRYSFYILASFIRVIA